jgi:hypothetical protein
MIVFSEASLYRHIKSFVAYYHESRTHLSLTKDAPVSRPVQGPEKGRVVSVPHVGGLHHRYERRAGLTARSSTIWLRATTAGRRFHCTCCNGSQ